MKQVIDLYRYNSANDHTNGLILVDGEFICYTLEDEYRAVKLKGETRIPDGEYKITFRTVGGFHNRYKDKFGSWHKGMLWLRDVPNFEYILIHAGNDDDDTAGCILVGSGNMRGENFIPSSVEAYKKLYPLIRNNLLQGNTTTIKVTTLDNFKN